MANTEVEKQVIRIINGCNKATGNASEGADVCAVLSYVCDMLGLVAVQLERVANVAEGNSNTGIEVNLREIARAASNIAEQGLKI